MRGRSAAQVWSCLDTDRLHLPHRVFVPQSRHHDDHPDVLLPHHPPEVGHGALQRPLGTDEVPLRSTTLNTNVTESADAHRTLETLIQTLPAQSLR